MKKTLNCKSRISEVVITSDYGVRQIDIEKKSTFHHGIDLNLIKGSEISFDCDVIVEAMGSTPEVGNYVVLWTDAGANSQRVRCFLCHLETIPTKTGFYKAGTVVCTTGNTGKYTTGAHLHFGVRLHTNGSHSRYDLSELKAKEAGYVNPVEYFDINLVKTK